MKNHLLAALFAIVFSTATSASAECPSDNADFCSQYELAEQGDAWARVFFGPDVRYWRRGYPGC